MTLKEETKEFGQHILHIEDLKPQQLLDLLKTINHNAENLIVTEKMDGFFMSFGEDEQGFYAGTKNTIWRTASDFPDLYFLSGLKRYITKLESVDIKGAIKRAFGFKNIGNVRITGESIPSHDHNIVIYDPTVVGDGIFVVYQITVDNKQLTNKQDIQKFIQQVQPHTSVKFFTNPEVAFRYKVPHKIVLSLEKLIQKNGNLFSKPARTQEDKELKQQLLEKIKQAGLLIKKDILSKPYNPVFGGDYEGYVVHLPDGSMVKIIDKEKFTKAKEQNWYFIDQLQRLERTFKLAIKRDPNSLPEQLKQFKSGVLSVKSDFEKNADNYITIPKKKSDTKEELILYARKLSNLSDLVKKKVPNDQIANMYLNKELNESVTSSIFEGGHAFGTEVNSVVPKQYLLPTIDKALKKLKLSSVDYKVVGNVSKPYLGDIDVALNTKDLVDAYDLDTSSSDSFWVSLEDKLISLGVSYKINKGFKQFHVSTSVVDTKGKVQPAIDANGETKEPLEKSVVQLDFFVGSVPWMTNILSGAPESSKYKAVYRNILLRSIVSKIRNPKKPNEKYVLDFRSGVDLVKFEEIPTKGKLPKHKELSRAQHLGDADTLAAWLFGPTYKWSNIDSFENLVTAFMSNKFRFPELRAEILAKFKEEIVKSKLPAQSLIKEKKKPEQQKTIGLFLGGFKPFHKGHMAGVEMASRDSDEVIVIASARDRDKDGFSMSGSLAMQFWKKYVLPIMPKNVKVIFSDRPYNELVRILHEEIEPSNNKVIIFGDKEDLMKNFGGAEYKKLQKYIPNILQTRRISVEQVPRLMSGTKMRNAIMNQDFKAFYDGLPEQLKPAGQEIFDFFIQQMR